MVPLTGIVVPLFVIGIKCPLVGELLAVPLPGSHHGTSVVSPADEGRWADAVEIPHTSEEPVRAVRPVVAPVATVSTLRDEIDSGHRLSRLAVEEREIVSALYHTSHVSHQSFPLLCLS